MFNQNSSQDFLLQGNLILEGQLEERGVLWVSGKTIIKAGKEGDFPIPKETTVISVPKDKYISPGLVDTHIHGLLGHDVMDATPKALFEIGRTLLRYGVTSYLPTTMSASLENIRAVIKNIVEFLNIEKEHPLLASIQGINLEGPWISKKKRGAQDSSYIYNPAIGDVKTVLDAAKGLLKTVTIAPEAVNDEQIFAYLKNNAVVVSAGHTNATYQEISEAIHCGVSQFTHGFNAMRAFDHREPGVVGAMLLSDVPTELICDLIHVHKGAIEVLKRLKGKDQIILISDAIKPTGLPDGQYDGSVKSFV